MNEHKGVKHSEGKLEIYTVLFKQFPRAFQEVVRSGQSGHIKYEKTDQNWDNWKYVKDAPLQYRNACMRHLMESEDFVWDDDMAPYGTGSRHLSAAIWNLLACLELDLIEEEDLLKREGMDEIKETSKLVPQEDVYVDLIPEQKEKMEEARRLSDNAWTSNNSYDPFIHLTHPVRLKPDQLIDKEDPKK